MFQNKLHIDVTQFIDAGLRTGIQRVISQVITNWESWEELQLVHVSPEGIRCVDVRSFIDFSQKSVNSQKYSEQVKALLTESKPILSHSANIDILDLDLNLNTNHRIEDLLQKYTTGSVYRSVFIHDVLPLTHKQYFPHTFVVDFVSWFLRLKHAKYLFFSNPYTAEITREIFEHKRWPLPRTHISTLGATSLTVENHNCFDYLSIEGVFKKNKIILCVSNFEPRKNHKVLFDAWRKVDFFDQASLVLVGGNAWMNEEIESARDLALRAGANIVKLKGIDDCCLEYLYSCSYFSVYPSLVEGFGLPILESLKYNLPIIFSNHESFNNLKDLPGTYSCATNDPLELTNALNRIWIDAPVLRANLNGLKIPDWSPLVELFKERLVKQN